LKFIVDTLNVKALEDNARQTIILHGGAGLASIGHLKFWIPIFELSKVAFVILTRDISVYEKLIEEFPALAIVYAKSPLDVEEVINNLEFLKVIFYTSNVGKNIHLLRFNHIKHIYIGSKDSEQLSKVTKFYRAYDEIYISGDSQIDKFKNEDIKLGHLKFVKVGKPQLKKMFLPTPKKNRISYIPSWEGSSRVNNLSSLKLMSELIYKIKAFDLELFIKLHSKTGKRERELTMLRENIAELGIYTKKDIFYKKFQNIRWTTGQNNFTILEYQYQFNELNKANLAKEEQKIIFESSIIICDLETLSLEYLALDVPVFVYIPNDKSIENYIENRYFSYDYAYTFSTIDELMVQLQQVLLGEDTLAEKREEAVAYWIGKEETVNSIFIEKLNQEYILIEKK